MDVEMIGSGDNGGVELRDDGMGMHDAHIRSPFVEAIKEFFEVGRIVETIGNVEHFRANIQPYKAHMMHFNFVALKQMKRTEMRRTASRIDHHWISRECQSQRQCVVQLTYHCHSQQIVCRPILIVRLLEVQSRKTCRDIVAVRFNFRFGPGQFVQLVELIGI